MDTRTRAGEVGGNKVCANSRPSGGTCPIKKPASAITEPARLEPVLRNRRGRGSERPAHRDEERSPLAATREGPRTETKTQHSQKIKIKINKLIN